MATYTDNYNLIKPSYSEIADVATINTNMNTIDDIMHSTQVSLAPAYDSTQTYNIGDVVMYELLMYKCKENGVTGTWNASKWERTTASECGDSGSDVEVTQIQTEGKAVASIAVDGVSTDILVPELKVYGEASGDLITIEDAMEAPLEECKVTLEPQQDLHGYDNPWAGGAGKNKLDIEGWLNSSGATYTKSGNAYTISAKSALFNTPFTFSDTDVPISASASSYVAGTATFIRMQLLDSNNSVVDELVANNSYQKKEGVVASKVRFNWSAGGTFIITEPQIELGSTATSYAPYSNICPISGWDEVDVTVADDVDNPTTSNVYTIQLGSTCYGGELDVKSGVLKVTDGYIASYNGETLPSTWISDRDVYAPNTSPTTGAEVVYKLATPQEIQLTPTEVTLLRGINNIWSDGEMYVKYRRDIEMLLQRIADSLGGNQ